MKHLSRAFTLVELLVVIGIIAVLIAILLPALQRARNQAVLVRCEANERMIALAMINYAADNQGFLPERTQATSGMYEIAQWSWMFSNGKNQGANDFGANLGQLIQTGYLGSYKINNQTVLDPSVAPFRFCPGQSGTAINGVMEDWHSSYFLNPHWSFTTFKNGVQTTWYRRLTDYPPQQALICEMMYGFTGNLNIVSHPGQGNSAFWNLAFRDGHVASVQDSLVIGVGATITSNSSYKYIRRFDDCVDILETEADGRSPYKSMALPGYAPKTWGSPTTYREFNFPNTTQYTPSIPYTGTVNWD